MRFSSAEGVRFLLGAALNTLATYGIYLGLLLVLSYRLAYTLAFAAGIVLSYAINTYLVFRRRWEWRRLAAFPLVYLLQYLLGLALLHVLVEWASVPAAFAPLLVVVLTVPITFILTRFVITGSRT